MKIFSFVGWSGSGKTMLIERLIKEYKKKGKKVSSVKLIKKKYNLEPESKDSFKFLDSGSDNTFLVSRNQLIKINKINEIEDFYSFLEEIDSDLIFIEGFTKNPNVPKIEVFNSKINKSLKYEDKIKAIITNENIKSDLPVFNKQEINKIIDFMENL